jgi:hypothetical protein
MDELEMRRDRLKLEVTIDKARLKAGLDILKKIVQIGTPEMISSEMDRIYREATKLVEKMRELMYLESEISAMKQRERNVQVAGKEG